MVFIPRFIFYVFSCALTCLLYQHKSMQKSCKPMMLGRIWQASKRALNLEHPETQEFACSEWQKRKDNPSNLYLLYRWLLFIFVTSTAIASFACQRLPKGCKVPQTKVIYSKWFIYFTNWGFLMIIVQSALALVVVHKTRADKVYNLSSEGTKDWKPTPLICRAYWLAYNVATDLAFVITLMYWSQIYDPDKHELDALNLLVHGGNSVVMLCEVCVCAHPVLFAHALYGAGAGLAYGVFSALYYAADGTDRCGEHSIYSKLDWKYPSTALGFVAACAVVMVLAHTFVTLLAWARTQLAKRLIKPQTEYLTTYYTE